MTNDCRFNAEIKCDNYSNQILNVYPKTGKESVKRSCIFSGTAMRGTELNLTNFFNKIIAFFTAAFGADIIGIDTEQGRVWFALDTTTPIENIPYRGAERKETRFLKIFTAYVYSPHQSLG